MPVLLLVSFSAMTNVWASSFLSHNERDFRFAVSSDTVRGSRISKQDSIFKTLNLDEVVVTAAIKEVEMKGDTTVINANAFKTAEGAYLEELLKRVPSLEYDKQTKEISYNGLPIHEINVNGESFFGGNTPLAPRKLACQVGEQNQSV